MSGKRKERKRKREQIRMNSNRRRIAKDPVVTQKQTNKGKKQKQKQRRGDLQASHTIHLYVHVCRVSQLEDKTVREALFPKYTGRKREREREREERKSNSTKRTNLEVVTGAKEERYKGKPNDTCSVHSKANELGLIKIFRNFSRLDSINGGQCDE